MLNMCRDLGTFVDDANSDEIILSARNIIIGGVFIL